MRRAAGVLRVGMLPFAPGFNPYQNLVAEALEAHGLDVVRVPPAKAFPLSRAAMHRLDVLHVDWPHDFYDGRNRATRAAKRVMYEVGLRHAGRRPLVWTAHNLGGHDARDPGYDHAMLQKLVAHCDAVVVLSKAAEAALRATFDVPGETLVEVVPHGHYVGSYPDGCDREGARRRLGLPRSARVVLFLGRILPYKGLGELVEAFAAAAREGEVLLIAGPASDPGLARDLVSAAGRRPGGGEIRVLPGLVAREEVGTYFAASDVAALPFRHILNSGSALLAMSMGRAFVGPRLGSLTEVAAGDAFFDYDPREPDGLARALRRALDAPDLLERGATAREHVLRANDWASSGATLATLYRRLVP